MNEKTMMMADRRSRSANSTKIFVLATSSQKDEKKDEKKDETKAAGIHSMHKIYSQKSSNASKNEVFAVFWP